MDRMQTFLGIVGILWMPDPGGVGSFAGSDARR